MDSISWETSWECQLKHERITQGSIMSLGENNTLSAGEEIDSEYWNPSERRQKTSPPAKRVQLSTNNRTKSLFSFRYVQRRGRGSNQGRTMARIWKRLAVITYNKPQWKKRITNSHFVVYFLINNVWIKMRCWLGVALHPLPCPSPNQTLGEEWRFFIKFPNEGTDNCV